MEAVAVGGLESLEAAAVAGLEAWKDIMGFSEDKFVVMMTSVNKGAHPPRKAFAENFMAFSMFAQKHDEIGRAHV